MSVPPLDTQADEHVHRVSESPPRAPGLARELDHAQRQAARVPRRRPQVVGEELLARSASFSRSAPSPMCSPSTSNVPTRRRTRRLAAPSSAGLPCAGQSGSIIGGPVAGSPLRRATVSAVSVVVPSTSTAENSTLSCSHVFTNTATSLAPRRPSLKASNCSVLRCGTTNRNATASVKSLPSRASR